MPLLVYRKNYTSSLSALECGGDDGTRTRGLCRDRVPLLGKSGTYEAPMGTISNDLERIGILIVPIPFPRSSVGKTQLRGRDWRPTPVRCQDSRSLRTSRLVGAIRPNCSLVWLEPSRLNLRRFGDWPLVFPIKTAAQDSAVPQPPRLKPRT